MTGTCRPEEQPLLTLLAPLLTTPRLTSIMGKATDLLYPLKAPSEAELLLRADEMSSALHAWESQLPPFLKPSRHDLTGSRLFESTECSYLSRYTLTSSRTIHGTETVLCTCSNCHQSTVFARQFRVTRPAEHRQRQPESTEPHKRLHERNLYHPGYSGRVCKQSKPNTGLLVYAIHRTMRDLDLLHLCYTL